MGRMCSDSLFMTFLQTHKSTWYMMDFDEEYFKETQINPIN